MAKPFFTIITRTMKGREQLFERNRQSVAAQAGVTVEHLVIRDDVGIGVSAAQKLLHKASPNGEYVLVLDDDDYLCAPDALAKVKQGLLQTRPPFAVVRVRHGIFGTMPMRWQETPGEGEITVSNVVVEHVQWYLHRGEFGARYAGDFDFVKSLFDAHAPDSIAWLDVDVATVEMLRNGVVEQPA